MIVCMCKGVSDRAIRAALDAGASGAEAIAGATGAGTDCGCCRQAIERMVARATPCASPPCPGCPRAGRADAA